jgi:hypothetical protein
MLFFIDESWQEVGGRDVGALAAVAIPRTKYNAFCREIWQIKHNILGAEELSESEIKGNSCFAKSAFRTREKTGHSKLLQAAEETLAAIPKYKGFVFAVSTDHEEWLLLRNPRPSELSRPYVELIHDFKRCMETQGGVGHKGLLFFDNRGQREDLSAACAIQNFIARVGSDWTRLFLQTPHFTPSAVSPGIQAADLVAYLTAHRHDPTQRPELHPYWRTVEGIAYRSKGRGRAVRAVLERPPRRTTSIRKGRPRRTS